MTGNTTKNFQNIRILVRAHEIKRVCAKLSKRINIYLFSRCQKKKKNTRKFLSGWLQKTAASWLFL